MQQDFKQRFPVSDTAFTSSLWTKLKGLGAMLSEELVLFKAVADHFI